MLTIFQAILLGVVSGIVTSICIFIIIQIIQKIIIPWYQTMIYRGVNISGTWRGARKNQEVILILKQKAHNITGIADLILDKDATHLEKIRNFKVKGTIFDRFVQLNLKHEDSSRLGAVSFLFQVEGDGRILKGGSTGYIPGISEIHSVAEEFTKDKE